MGVQEFRWAVCPGSGRVAHFGHAVALLVPTTAEQAAFARSLLGMVETAAGGSDANALFREISGLVIDTRADRVAPFGVLADDGDKLAVLLCGPVALYVRTQGGGEERLSAADSATYLDHRISDPIAELTLTAGGASATPTAGTDLRLGLVAGAGLSAGPRTSTYELPAPSDAAEPPSTAQQTTAPATAASAPVPPRPENGFISVAPHSAAARVPVATKPHGVTLLLPDSRRVDVSRDVVLGRIPETADDVQSGAADPVHVADVSVSRVHARITIADGGLLLTDLGSSNGTSVLLPSATAWARLEPHVPARLAPGTHVLLGSCELTCDYAPVGASIEPESYTVVSRRDASRSGPAGGIADYSFVRSLGAAYQGEFFLAVPPGRLGLAVDHVRVKVISGTTSDDAFRRAVRELRAYNAVESPYLLPVHDAGNDAGRIFYAMPYLQRGSLAELAAALDPAEVVMAVAHAARAAHALHEANLAHLDITPRGIVLDDESAYLSDVGATQSLHGEQTFNGRGATDDLEFTAPQVLLGQRGTRAADIWSLGATLYRALTGSSVYGDIPADTFRAIRLLVTGEPTFPVAIDESILAVVRDCLRKDEADRPPTAAEVANRLDAITGTTT